MDNCQQWFYLCCGFLVLLLALFAMFFGYSLQLDKRTIKLEKKNGHEQHQIDELKKEIQKLKTKS